jgi:TPR repeat protein
MATDQERTHSLAKEGQYSEAEGIRRRLLKSGSLEAAIELAAVLDRQDPGSAEASELIINSSKAIEEGDFLNHYLLYLAMCYRDIGDSDFIARQAVGYHHLVLAAAPPDGLPAAMIEMATSYARGTVTFERNFELSEEWYRNAEACGDSSVRQDAADGLKELARLRKKAATIRGSF